MGERFEQDGVEDKEKKRKQKTSPRISMPIGKLKSFFSAVGNLNKGLEPVSQTTASLQRTAKAIIMVMLIMIMTLGIIMIIIIIIRI